MSVPFSGTNELVDKVQPAGSVAFSNADFSRYAGRHTCMQLYVSKLISFATSGPKKLELISGILRRRFVSRGVVLREGGTMGNCL